MSEKMKNRPEDQRMPVPTSSPHMHDVAAAHLLARKELGVSRYGQPLQAHNRRDAVQDALEEALDVAAYMAQVSFEQDSPGMTYVGRIIAVLPFSDVTIDFRGVFVPDAVLQLCAANSINVLTDD